MKDPIIAEVRKHRMEHTLQFHSNLHLICENLREFEATLGSRLVKPETKRVLSSKNHKGIAQQNQQIS